MNAGESTGLEYEDLTHKIISAAIEVHRKLGPGFIESIFKNALFIELEKKGLSVKQEYEIPIAWTYFKFY